jgi:hypothetical protein
VLWTSLASAEPGWSFRSAAAARRLAWPDVGAMRAEPLDPSQPLPLLPTSVVLVPIEPGDYLQLEGVGVWVGLGSGSGGPYPDAITWQAAAASGELRIPTWSTARFVALRSDQPQSVRLRVAARSERSLAEHRLDAAVYDWLVSRVEPPRTDDVGERRELLALHALDRLLAGALVVGAEARDARSVDLRARYLHASWLGQRLLRRSLVRPFFLPRSPVTVGGELIAERTDSEESAREWRWLRPGEILSVPAQGADVVRFDVRARALGRSRVPVFSDDVVAIGRGLRGPAGRDEQQDREK